MCMLAATARRRRSERTTGTIGCTCSTATCGCCLGDEDLTIEPGEAVEFATTTPHWFGAVDGPVELIAIFGPHGQRSHLHR